MNNDSERAPSGQALAVPAGPVSRPSPSGFDPSRRDYPQKWEDAPFSAGQRMVACGWTVGRTHDERDNFYMIYDPRGNEVREYRNDLRLALLYAEYAIAIEAASAGETAKTGSTRSAKARASQEASPEHSSSHHPRGPDK